jgi:hypothetical protein
MCEFETNDRVVDELLAKCTTLVGVLGGFFVADSAESQALNDYADSFVVEIGHNDWGSCQ